jgi:hypothetical protein
MRNQPSVPMGLLGQPEINNELGEFTVQKKEKRNLTPVASMVYCIRREVSCGDYAQTLSRTTSCPLKTAPNILTSRS